MMSLHESFADSVDAFLQISHGRPSQRSSNERGGNEPVSVAAAAAPVREEALPSKLLRHAQGSTGLLALLPESVCDHVPLIAAQILAAVAASESIGVLWVLPEAMVGPARDFWEQFVRSAPRQTGPPPLTVRPLEHTPVANGAAPPLRAGEIAFCSLDAVVAAASAGSSSDAPPTPEPVAGLVVLTASSPEMGACEAIGRVLIGSPPRCRLVALLCGMPPGGSAALSPLCTALGVRRLLLRAERDPDVLALRSTHRSIPYVVPAKLKLAFETLVSDATRELGELLEARPDLAPLPFESKALKQRIEQTNAQSKAARASGGGGSHDADQAVFWSLMACFCARRLLDCAEDADAASFSGFMEQVLSKKQSKLTHTFQRRQALKAILAQREELGAAIASFETSKLHALTHAIKSAVKSGFSKTDLHLSASRHGLIALRQCPRSTAIFDACEAAVRGSRVSVHQIDPEKHDVRMCAPRAARRRRERDATTPHRPIAARRAHGDCGSWWRWRTGRGFGVARLCVPLRVRHAARGGPTRRSIAIPSHNPQTPTDRLARRQPRCRR